MSVVVRLPVDHVPPGAFTGTSTFVQRAGCPALELLEVRPRAQGGGAPLLFVHGAFSGAWSWNEGFLSYFGRRGRYAAAVSLRGHGGSEGRTALRKAGLDDLAGDVAAAIDAMPEPPVVVGHSLGGYLAQMLLGRTRMRGLVLVGSIPPDGMSLVGPRLALTDMRAWAEAITASVTNSDAATTWANIELLFGDGIPIERVRDYAARMVPESPRALAEAHFPRPITSAALARVPTLVLNGAGDRLVWPATALRTVLYHGAQHTVFPTGGHFLMLDPLAEDVARVLDEWLSDRQL